MRRSRVHASCSILPPCEQGFSVCTACEKLVPYLCNRALEDEAVQVPWLSKNDGLVIVASILGEGAGLANPTEVLTLDNRGIRGGALNNPMGESQLS